MNNILKKFIIDLLRRGSYKWKSRTVAKMKARVQVGEYSTGRPKYGYKCSHCGEVFKAKDICLDHTETVVPLDGYASGLDFDLNEYASRMFCTADGFSVLCGPCHDVKTKEENKIRRENKKKRSL